MLPYYKRYPRKFFDATIGWNWEEKSIYGLVIDLIFMLDGKLPDDARYIAGQLGCSVRKWNSIREKLIISGKLEVKNEIISNKTADDLLIEQRSYRDKKAENRSRPNKNKDVKSRPSTVSRDKKIKDKKDTISDEIVSQKARPIDDVSEAFEAYQSTARKLMADNAGDVVWPLVEKFTKERRAKLRSRLKENGIDAWRTVLAKASASSHCLGDNKRQWTASFDFLVSPSGFIKTLEGNYDDRTPAAGRDTRRGVRTHAHRSDSNGLDAFDRVAERVTGQQAVREPATADMFDGGGGGPVIDAEKVDGAWRCGGGEGSGEALAGALSASGGGSGVRR